MIPDRYICCDEGRRIKLTGPGAPAGISGIDYIEVRAGATTLDPTYIDIHLVKPLPLPAAALTSANILLTGGVRFPAPSIQPAVDVSPGGGTVETYTLTIPAAEPTDFSTYHLAIVAAAGSDAPPPFLDPRLSEVEFSFKIGCPSDFDCASDCEQPPGPNPAEPLFDYRTRDYDGFRQQMLDRLCALLPAFKQDDASDFTTTLVEMLAYRADQQSYRLDWVGTEAFLSTARSRTSIARHVRLVDYLPGEGVSARVFASFTFTPDGAHGDGSVLPASTPLLVRKPDLPMILDAAAYSRAVRSDPLVFETMAELPLWGWRNSIAIHTWSDSDCLLPSGSTAVTLADGSAGGPGGLAVGDFLLLIETRSPETGATADASVGHRQIVRLTKATPVIDVLEPATKLVTVEWDAGDALGFDLVIQAHPQGTLESAAPVVCAEVRGNIMLADHGLSLPPPAQLGLGGVDTEALRPTLTPPTPPASGLWLPILDRGDIAQIVSVNLIMNSATAASLAKIDATACLPALWLDDDFAVWNARRDLIASEAFDRDFVIETGIDGRESLRFGDDIHGMKPGVGAALVPSGRFGIGMPGNIGIGALAHVAVPPSLIGARIGVTNPLAAQGGADPEKISAIRIAAPQAFRRQERAVTVQDYADAARKHPEVANAIAVARWTGAWQTILVYVDRKDGLAVDDGFRAELLAFIEDYRLMGFDVALKGAVMAPLDIELLVCAKPGEIRGVVAGRVRDALRPMGSVANGPGFFDPENFTFGSPLYLSRLLAAVMAVPGVQSVTPRRFQRLGRLAQGELATGMISPSDFEVLQLDDDPSFPERGKLVLDLGGGR